MECDAEFKADCVRRTSLPKTHKDYSTKVKISHWSVKEHIAFKCKFIVDGKTKINEFYQRRKKKSFFSEIVA